MSSDEEQVRGNVDLDVPVSPAFGLGGKCQARHACDSDIVCGELKFSLLLLEVHLHNKYAWILSQYIQICWNLG